MLLKSDTVHEAWAATQRTVGVKLTIKETEYDASDITSLTFDSGAMNGEALTLGSTYQNTIKVVFSRLIEGLTLTDEIAPELGIKLPDGTWDYTPLGVFVIDAEVQQDRNNNTTTISASDRMCMMGGTYESKLTYPAAINDIAVEIANLAAVKLNDDDFARLPTDKIASLGEVTYRDAIGFVAQFAGGFATFDRDGLLDIRQLADPNFEVAPSQYQSKGLTKNEALYRIGGIACTVTTTTKDDSGNETQDTKTLQSGSSAGTQITISNPGMTQDLLDGLYDQLQDLNFYPFSLSWFGDPNLEAGDWIEVQDTAGNTFKTPNLLYALTFSGGVTATSKADTTVSASANFVYKGQLNQVVNNIRQYLNASGHAVSEGIDEPKNPKAGDIWFKKDGPDTTIMTYVVDPETGVGSWVEEVSTKGVTGLDEALKKAKAQLDADIAAAKTDLAVAKQDVADLQVNLKANDETQAQLTTDLAANSTLITKNKADVDAALVTVNKTLTQAQTDTATAVKNADLAVANAKSAVNASGLANTTANAASDAANAANQLATEVSNNFATVKTQAATAASDAATALGQAKSALDTASSVQTGMQPAITAAVNTAKGELTASIKTVSDGLSGLSVGGRNYLQQSSTFKWARLGEWHVDTEAYQGHAVLTGTQTVNNSSHGFSYTSLPCVNSDVVVSFYAKAAKSSRLHSEPHGVGGGSGATDFRLTTEWARYSYKAHVGLTGTIYWWASDANIQMWVTMPQVEIGTVVSDYHEAPEDVQSQITTNSTKITENSKLIAASATQESVNTLTQQVTNNTAQLKLTATEADLKLATQSVDTLTGRVTTAEGKITATSEALKAVYTKSETTNLLGGYATQTWAQNQIDVSADGISTTISSVQTQVQNSAVGTNLLTNTSDFSSNWGAWDGQLSVSTTTEYNGYPSMVFASSSNLKLKKQQLSLGTLNNSTQYTSSFWAKADNAGDKAHTELWGSIGATDFVLTTNWVRYTAVVTSYSYANTNSERSNCYFGVPGGNKGNVYIALPKLEKGSVATDWCPNPADNATVTAVSKLSQTVDGFSTTFAKQTDLTTATAKFKVTADGLNLLTTATGTNGEKVTQVIADVNNIKSTMTGANGYTTRLQTLEGFQNTATIQLNGKASQSQVTQLATQIDSVVGGLGNPNLVYNSEFDNKLEGWAVTGTWGYATSDWSTGEAGGIVINSTDPTMTIVYAASKDVPVTGGQYSAAADLTIESATGATSYAQLYVKFRDATGAQTSYKFQAFGLGEVGTAISGKTHVKLEGITPDANAKSVQLILRAAGAIHARWQHPMLVNAATIGAYQPDTVGYSQITQLQGLIDERVMVDGKIAAALSLSADGGGTVTIRGASLYVTAASHFDTASIQSAAIASLDAAKITSGSISSDRLATTNLNADNITSGSIAAARIATTSLSATNITSGTLDVGKLTVKNLSANMIASGTIDASKIAVKNLSASNIIGGTLDAGLVNVKKLNASNIITGTLNASLVNVIGLNAAAITAGTITGAHLAINLNTGQVTFQSGRIHSTTNNIDINIDKGYISTADATTRVILKDGEMQFVEPNYFSTESSPYLRIYNGISSGAWNTAAVVGRDCLTISNSANLGDGLMPYYVGKNTFSGLRTGKTEISGWGPTYVGGAERGVVIVGGGVTSKAMTASSPYIRVGSSLDGQGVGSRIYMFAEYIHAKTIYKHTASGSANVIVAPDGTLVRTSSATKYKSNIERFRNTDMGEALLNLPQAHWYNKGDMQRYADDPQHYSMPMLDYGMIAEDLAAAGLEDLVVRGDDGQLEDIRYDRIGPALLPLLAQMKQEIEELKGEK